MATLKFSKMQPSTSDLMFTGCFLSWSINSLVNFLPVSLTVLTAAERRAGVQIWRHLNITHLASSWQHAVAQASSLVSLGGSSFKAPAPEGLICSCCLSSSTSPFCLHILFSAVDSSAELTFWGSLGGNGPLGVN
ncbi:hypothetical protein CY35_15G007800 [Sphagnum magellanicum]|nr:hypothetical protein CY35_15G007800 [Sphagnum magellanicum]KAH9538479.1 hypothetical protein CY35_15G007800 [Sphagnum magellanicum]